MNPIAIRRRLLAAGEAMIADDGHVDFELHTRTDNHSTIAFYQQRVGR